MHAVLFLIILLCIPACTQETEPIVGSIRGRTLSVIDSTTMAWTEVLLLGRDSTLSGTVSETDGVYLLEAIPPGEYVLRARYVGFETTDTPIVVSGGHTQEIDLYIGRIIPVEELLFGAMEARRDIAAGQIELLEFAVIDATHFYVPDSCYERVRSLFDERMAEIDSSYGYSWRDITERYRDQDWFVVQASVKQYNQEVWRYLTERNGNGWTDRRALACVEAKQLAIQQGCP